MISRALESIETPARVMFLGKSLCSRAMAAHLADEAKRGGVPLTIGLDQGEDAPASGEPVDVVVVCASECSGQDDPRVFDAALERYPDARLIAISPRAHAYHLVTALDSGAKGFVACGIDDIGELAAALAGVLEGDIAFSNEVSRLIVTTLRRSGVGRRADSAGPGAGAVLSDREFGVLSLLCDGLSNQQIANALGLSPNTVKNHLARLYRKLGVDSRTEAISLAMRLGLI